MKFHFMENIHDSKFTIIPLDQNNTYNYHKTGIYYKSKTNANDLNLPVKKGGLFKTLFVNKNEKYFMEAINNLNKNNKDSALKLLRQINNEIDAKFLISTLINDKNERKKLFLDIINKRDELGKYFQVSKILLEINIHFSNNIIFSLCTDKEGINIFYAEGFYYTGCKDKAIKVLENSNLLNKEIICLFLTNLYCERREYKKAIKVIQNARRKENITEPINTISLLLLGKLLRKLKLHHSAIDIFRHCRRYNKNRSKELIHEGRYQLGLTYELIGEENLAIIEYEKILAYNYDFRDVNQRLKQIAK